MALFVAQEADELELDKESEQANAFRQLTAASDALLAFANLDPSAGALFKEAQTAVADAKERTFDIVLLPSDGQDEMESEVFRHPLVLRSLLGRIAAIYMLDPAQLEHGLTISQDHLLRICRNFSAAIWEMRSKKLIALPRGEHDVKQLLFAIVRTSFVDAIPDGGISFNGQFQKHRPDFGVPSLKCCVETKVARDRTSMSSAIDGIIADQSTYGSDQYQTFIGVIYTGDASLTQEQLDQEIAIRKDKGGEPKYAWHWVLVRGLLQPSQKRPE